MSNVPTNQAGTLIDIITRIQSVDVEKAADDAAARAELLLLARKLTDALEGPINRATDLVFKVSTP